MKDTFQAYLAVFIEYSSHLHPVSGHKNSLKLRLVRSQFLLTGLWREKAQNVKYAVNK